MIETPAVRTRRTRYDEAVKELAYEVYAKRCNADMPETMKVLDTLIDPPLSKNTVYQWREDHQWDQRLQAEKQAIAPHSWDLYFGGLAVAAPELVTYLRSVVNDPDRPDRDRIAASGKLLGQIAVHIGELERRMSGDRETQALSDAELLRLETPWHPEDQGDQTP